jgi:alkylation response protein AidB-like acyl-CoA dehydrogenase
MDDELRQTVRAALARLCPPAVVRAAWGAPLPRALWREFASAGVLGLLVPEAHGGLGLTEVELAIALEEAGRVALPGPVVETAAVAPAILPPEQLPRLAAGELVVAIGGDPVPHALDADLVIVGGIARAAADVTLAPVPAVDGTRRLARVTPRGAGVSVGDAPDRGALGAAAVLLGLARRMLEMAVEHVKVREQFGRPVGSFQAVKHHLANAAVRVELAAPVVARAATAAARREATAGERASMAKACASDAALFVARVALQCHGAIGYAFEHDLHMWMKRTWALAGAWGDAASHRARLAAAVLDRGLELEDGDG